MGSSGELSVLFDVLSPRHSTFPARLSPGSPGMREASQDVNPNKANRGRAEIRQRGSGTRKPGIRKICASMLDPGVRHPVPKPMDGWGLSRPERCTHRSMLAHSVHGVHTRLPSCTTRIQITSYEIRSQGGWYTYILHTSCVKCAKISLVSPIRVTEAASGELLPVLACRSRFPRDDGRLVGEFLQPGSPDFPRGTKVDEVVVGIELEFLEEAVVPSTLKGELTTLDNYDAFLYSRARPPVMTDVIRVDGEFLGYVSPRRCD